MVAAYRADNGYDTCWIHGLRRYMFVGLDLYNRVDLDNHYNMLVDVKDPIRHQQKEQEKIELASLR